MNQHEQGMYRGCSTDIKQQGLEIKREIVQFTLPEFSKCDFFKLAGEKIESATGE